MIILSKNMIFKEPMSNQKVVHWVGRCRELVCLPVQDTKKYINAAKVARLDLGMTAIGLEECQNWRLLFNEND